MEGLSTTVASTGAKSERNQASMGVEAGSPTSLGEVASAPHPGWLRTPLKFDRPLGSQEPGWTGVWICRSIS